MSRSVQARPRGPSDPRAAGYLDLLFFVSSTANESGSLEEAVTAVLPELARRTGWPVAHVYRWDGEQLRPSALWHLADPERYAWFRRVTEATCFRMGEGLPGRVLAARAPEWIEDVARSPDFARVDARAARPLGAGLAVPLCTERRPWAVLELFHEQSAPEDPALLEVMSHVGLQLGRVAEREESERRLRDSERRFAELADNLDSVFWIMDEGRLDYVSPAFERVWGRPRAEVSGDPGQLFRHIHEADREGVRRALWRAYREGRLARVRYRVEHPDGDVRWVRTRAFPVRDDSGRVLRYAGLTDDVTEELRARSQLEAKDRLLAGTFESVGDAILVVEAETRRVVECNRAAEEMLGYAREELVGGDTRPLHVDEAAFRRFDEAGREALAHKGVFETEWELRRKDGSTFPTEHRVTLMDPEPGDSRRLAVSVFRDLSARRDLERQLRHSQRMEALGGLAAGVAHDFNNLLTVIRGHADLLAETLPHDAPDREAADEILDAAGRAADLTWQLLAFGREQRLEPRPVRLNDVIADMERLLRRVIGEDVELRTRLDPEIPAAVLDPTQIQQVLVNLAVNARDAMPDGGTLRIETSRVDFAAPERAPEGLGAGGHVQLEVSDTGHGMDAPTRARIFEPFFTTKPKGVGTGLGLASVYGIVRQSGGAIEVESAPGQGARFRLIFPAAREEGAQAEVPEDPVAAAPAGRRILVVEDDERVRLVLMRILERAGHRVETAAGVAEARARAAAQGEGFDLVLTDAVLPDGHGPDLIEELRARRPGLRAVLTSGYLDGEEAGIPYLPKPFTPEDVLACVREALDEG